MRATEGVVHLWRADLATIGDRPTQLLCKEELARAARMPARKRVLWTRSRGVLRALLGRYLDRDPRELEFVLGPLGKPALRCGERREADLRFNLSHSGDLVLVAVTAGREVGVDIERARERYTPKFLRAWVAREAAVKCFGTGLATSQAARSRDDLWTTELDVGPDFAAAVAVAGGPCELHSWDWRA